MPDSEKWAVVKRAMVGWDTQAHAALADLKREAAIAEAQYARLESQAEAFTDIIGRESAELATLRTLLADAERELRPFADVWVRNGDITGTRYWKAVDAIHARLSVALKPQSSAGPSGDGLDKASTTDDVLHEE